MAQGQPWQDETVQALKQGYEEQLAFLVEENKKLREALEEISNMKISIAGNDYSRGYNSAVRWAGNIARVALATGEKQ